jgi:hypothetical protein
MQKGRKKKVEDLSLDCAREKLLDIEQKYVEAILPFERSWTTDKRKEGLFEKLLSYTEESEFASALLSFEEGFSWPISIMEQKAIDEMDMKLVENPEADIEMSPIVEKRRGMVRRFWKSDPSQDEWKNYVASVKQG